MDWSEEEDRGADYITDRCLGLSPRCTDVLLSHVDGSANAIRRIIGFLSGRTISLPPPLSIRRPPRRSCPFSWSFRCSLLPPPSLGRRRLRRLAAEHDAIGRSIDIIPNPPPPPPLPRGTAFFRMNSSTRRWSRQVLFARVNSGAHFHSTGSGVSSET